MKTTPHPTHQEPVVQSNQPSARRLVRSGALAGAIAAVCTTVVAAIASAADVSLEINAKAIPMPAFACGGPSSVPPSASCWPDPFASADGSSSSPQSPLACHSSHAIPAPDDTATKAVLVGTHLLAAAVIIPTLSQRLEPVRLLV